MTEQQQDLLKEAGLLSDTQQPENVLPTEMTDPEFLESPLGRIMQSLAALQMAAESFSERLSTCERFVMFLVAKDPTLGPSVAKLDEAAKKAGIASGVELRSAGIDVKFGGSNEGRSE